MKNILQIFCQVQVMQYDQHAKNNYLFLWHDKFSLGKISCGEINK